MTPAHSVLLCALWWNCQVSVLTYHNDLARTGQNLNETILTPANVSSGQFGPRFSYAVDGQIYAQPLYLPGVVIPGKGIHNVVFVATEHDSVYAFDADNYLAEPLWHASFLNPAQGVTTASASDLGCDSITPEVGITGTPVIDPDTRTLYVVAMTAEASLGGYVQRLHALDVTTGAERPGSPVEIQASVPGQGDGNSTVQFKPWFYKERAGLLLLDGVVYTSWSSHCDSGNYHGWIIGYKAWSWDAQGLQQAAVYTSTPDWDAGSFWQGGAAPAADTNGNIYVASANGTFDANMGGSDLGDSIIKLSMSSTSKGLVAADYFAPYDAGLLDTEGLDLGSSGVLLLPDSAGSAAHPHLLVGGSKQGTVYLLDRDNLGHFHAGTDDQIVQSLVPQVGPTFGVPAYFNNTVYFSAAHDQVKAFAVHNGLMSTLPVSASTETFDELGTVPSISANGVRNGILWTIDPAAELRAYDATDLTHELYRASVGSYVKFSTPTIANGKVYVGTLDSLVVFGLESQASTRVTSVVSAADFKPGPVAPGSIISIFGSNLAPSGTVFASASPWSKAVDGTSVFVNGLAVPLAYLSPTQINAQIRSETPAGQAAGQATVTVVVGEQVLPGVELTVQPIAPRLFVDAQNYAMAQNQDGTANGTSHPAAPGTLLTVYLTGQGVRPPASITAAIGEQTTGIVSASVAPGLLGVFEVSVRVPVLATGDHSLTIDVGGAVSNAALVSVGVN